MRELQRDESLTCKGLGQRTGQQDRQNASGERRDRRPGQSGAIADRSAAVQRGNALEVVVGAVAVGEPENG